MDTVRTLCVQGKDISSNSPELPTVRQRLLDHVVQTANPETHWCSYWGRAALVAEIGCHWGSICRERASLVFMGMIRVVPRKEAAAYGITARTTVVQLLEPAIRMRQQGSATLKGALPEAAAASPSSGIEGTAALERAAVLPLAVAQPAEPETEEAVKLLLAVKSANGKIVLEDDARDIIGRRKHLVGHIRRIAAYYATQTIIRPTGGGWWREALTDPERWGRDAAGVEIEQDRERRKLECSGKAKHVTGEETDTERRGRKMLEGLNHSERDEWIDWLVTYFVEEQRPDVVDMIADPEVPWGQNRDLHFAIGMVAWPEFVKERHRERGLQTA